MCECHFIYLMEKTTWLIVREGKTLECQMEGKVKPTFFPETLSSLVSQKQMQLTYARERGKIKLIGYISYTQVVVSSVDWKIKQAVTVLCNITQQNFGNKEWVVWECFHGQSFHFLLKEIISDSKVM